MSITFSVFVLIIACVQAITFLATYNANAKMTDLIFHQKGIAGDVIKLVYQIGYALAKVLSIVASIGIIVCIVNIISGQNVPTHIGCFIVCGGVIVTYYKLKEVSVMVRCVVLAS